MLGVREKLAQYPTSIIPFYSNHEEANAARTRTHHCHRGLRRERLVAQDEPVTPLIRMLGVREKLGEDLVCSAMCFIRPNHEEAHRPLRKAQSCYPRPCREPLGAQIGPWLPGQRNPQKFPR